MRIVTSLVCACAAALALAPGAVAQVTETAQVQGLEGNRTAHFPRELLVVAPSPSEYRRGCCLDSNSGEWLGPPYSDTSRPSSGGDSTIDWSAGVAPASGSEAAAAAALIHGYREYERGALAVPHVIGGRPAGTISGSYVATQGGPFSNVAAQAEGALAFPLGGGLFATARFALLAPSADDAPPSGTYRVNHSRGSTLASEWNRQQLATALAAVRLDGNLPPRRVTARRSGRTVRGDVTDALGHALAGARVRLERRRGSRWRRAASALTSTTGRYTLRTRGPGRYRVTCTLGTVTKRSRALAG